jgi:hypothetical protein
MMHDNNLIKEIAQKYARAFQKLAPNKQKLFWNRLSMSMTSDAISECLLFFLGGGLIDLGLQWTEPEHHWLAAALNDKTKAESLKCQVQLSCGLRDP